MDLSLKNIFFQNKTSRRHKIAGIIILLGFFTAVLSAMETKAAWISALCGIMGDGCRETVQYNMAGIPVYLWGVAYYTLLILLYFLRPAWLFFPVMAGCGTEAVLVFIMVKMRLPCLLCGVNFLWMLILFFCLFDKKRISVMLCLGLGSYIPANALITAPHDAAGQNGHAALAAFSDVLARVDGEEITREEVERPLTTRLYTIQQAVYKLKYRILESRIREILLEKAAAEKASTVEALTQALVSKVPVLEDHVVDNYYRTKQYQQWGNWQGTEAQIKEKIRKRLVLEWKNLQISKYCRELEKRYPVSIYLEKPPLPLTNVTIEGSPSTGPAHAPVIIVELSDYLCPSCRKGHSTVKRIREKYKGKIKWVFKDIPLERIHPGAKALALAARCAHEQGQFWAYQDLLFSESTPNPDDIFKYAQELGLDLNRFRECSVDPKTREQLDLEVTAARNAGISSTPTLIINGKLRVGIPSFEQLCRLIDQALQDSDFSK